MCENPPKIRGVELTLSTQISQNPIALLHSYPDSFLSPNFTADRSSGLVINMNERSLICFGSLDDGRSCDHSGLPTAVLGSRAADGGVEAVIFGSRERTCSCGTRCQLMNTAHHPASQRR